MDDNKPIGIDATGYELLTNAVRELLNRYPGLGDEVIRFEELDQESGIAFSADNGALVMTEKVSITDHVSQTCQYPFYVVFRAKGNFESQKIKAQAFLNTLGKWLCKEPVAINGETYRLTKYPSLSDGRKITKVTRMNSYGLEPQEDKVQDWLLPCTVQYVYEYDKW